MAAAPVTVLVVLAGVVGLVVGSFLNVVVHRVPAGESVVTPASRCPACRTPVAVRDNVPVVSWLRLRGRCRSCHEPISWRYPAVEAGTAAAFAAVAASVGWSWSLLPLLYLAAISIALALIDVDVHRLPDAIVLPSLVVLPVLLVPDAVAAGEWWPLVRAVIGAVGLFAVYYLLALVYPGGIGGGDVKLAAVLGLALAWAGWAELAVGAFAAFLLGGVYSLVLVALGRAGMKSSIPFGPFMLAGAWTGLAAGDAVAGWYLASSGLA